HTRALRERRHGPGAPARTEAALERSKARGLKGRVFLTRKVRQDEVSLRTKRGLCSLLCAHAPTPLRPKWARAPARSRRSRHGSPCFPCAVRGPIIRWRAFAAATASRGLHASLWPPAAAGWASKCSRSDRTR